MLLPPYEANLFFRLQKTLLCFVNQQVRVSSELLSLGDFAIPRTEEMLKLRDELIQKPNLLDSFLRQNPADLSTVELAIVSAWRQGLHHAIDKLSIGCRKEASIESAQPDSLPHLGFEGFE